MYVINENLNLKIQNTNLTRREKIVCSKLNVKRSKTLHLFNEKLTC